jgi:ATP diphosphatase
VDVSAALRHANAKFERRFRNMESVAGAGKRRLEDMTLAEQEALWVQAKRTESAIP